MAAGKTSRTPNGVLRGIRERERHETRSEFAEAMARVARELGEDVYPDAKYVERLESGAITWPRPPYRNILARLCDRPVGELGFTAPLLSVSASGDTRDATPARVNVPLRDAILASGMEVGHLARQVGVDPKTVQRWITQGRIPHPRHRWKACRILGREESELWPATTLAILANSEPQDRFDESAGQVFRASSFAEIDDMNRRELLRVMTMAGTLLAMGAIHNDIDWERLDYFAGHASRLDSQTVDEYASLNAHLWRVFVLSRTKDVIFPLVRDQLDVLTNGLESASGTATYQRLCELTSSLFQLAGEILFDKNQYTDAAHCYTLAATAGKEANMPDLWACALTRHAYIGAYERRFEKSVPMLTLAAKLAQWGDNTLSTRHWVSVVRAQTFAGLGDLEACQRALDMAERVHDLQGDSQNGGWLRFDGSRLAEERGTCYVQLQRPDLAESALTDALSMNLSARRRGSVLTDLAILGTQRHDLEQTMTYADAAVQMASETGSGVIVRKLKGLQPQLTPFLSDARARNLRIRIAALSRKTSRS